jgi:hypothetical protein
MFSRLRAEIPGTALDITKNPNFSSNSDILDAIFISVLGHTNIHVHYFNFNFNFYLITF